jgi:hypothetical protein
MRFQLVNNRVTNEDLPKRLRIYQPRPQSDHANLTFRAWFAERVGNWKHQCAQLGPFLDLLECAVLLALDQFSRIRFLLVGAERQQGIDHRRPPRRHE